MNTENQKNGKEPAKSEEFRRFEKAMKEIFSQSPEKAQQVREEAKKQQKRESKE